MERVELSRHGVREWSCVSVGCVCVSLFLLFCNLFVGVLGLRTISIPEFIVVVGVNLSNFLMVSTSQHSTWSLASTYPTFSWSHIPAFNMVVDVNLSNFLMVSTSQHSTWSQVSTYPTFSWSPHPSIQRGRRCQPIQLSHGLISQHSTWSQASFSISNIPAFNLIVGVNLSNFFMVSSAPHSPHDPEAPTNGTKQRQGCYKGSMFLQSYRHLENKCLT